jgi:hypothetical protein
VAAAPRGAGREKESVLAAIGGVETQTHHSDHEALLQHSEHRVRPDVALPTRNLREKEQASHCAYLINEVAPSDAFAKCRWTDGGPDVCTCELTSTWEPSPKLE